MGRPKFPGVLPCLMLVLTIPMVFSQSPPVVQHPSTVYTGTTGGFVVLGCIVSANPTATSVTWVKTTGTGAGSLTVDNTKYQDGNVGTPSLRINSLTQADAGTYVCQATNAGGTGQTTGTTLTVTGTPPTVTIGQNNYQVAIAGTVTIVCNVNSNPTQTGVGWQKLVNNAYQDVSITTNSRYNTGGTTTAPTFIITNAQSSDAGTYRCTATNQFGTTNSGNTVLTVTGNAPIVQHPSAVYTGTTGGSVQLGCIITANPAATIVEWFKTSGTNTGRITVGTGKYQNGNTGAPFLTINSLTQADAGTYVCQATNAFGTTQSTGTTLTVTGTPPTVTIGQNNYQVAIAGTVTIACNVNSNPTQTGVGWQKLVNNAYQDVSITTNSRYNTGGTTTAPTFIITNAQSSDAGTYRCTATNQFGTSNSGNTVLTVTGNAPTVQHPSTVYTGTTGGSVQLGCIITANPAATIVEWFKTSGTNTGRITVGTGKYQNGNTGAPFLTINSLTQADAGTYVCQATNAFGTTQSTGTTLTVTGTPPTVTIGQNNYQVAIAGTVTIVCNVNSNPTQTGVGWQKLVNNAYQDVSITTNSRYNTGGTTTAPTFIITNAQSSDAGTYRCTATNQFGTSNSGNTVLTVTGNAPTVQHPSTVYTGTTGGSVQLGCIITANPAATIVEWFKTSGTNTGRITVGTGKYQNGNTGAPFLTINSLTQADAGTYVCQATNAFGTTQSTGTTLTVTGTPPTVTIGQNNYQVAIAGTVTIVCNVNSNPTQTGVGWQKLVNNAYQDVSITTNSRYNTGGTTTAPTFIITNAQSSDAGTYRCTATNQFGTSNSGNTVLTVTGNAPTVQHPLTTYTGTTGGSVQLGCIITANPAATIVEWFKTSGTNTGRITVGTAKYQNGNTGAPSLTINSLTQADAGTYVCQATNAFGTSQSTGTTLTVTGTVATASIPLSSYTVVAGQQITIPCNVAGNPAVTSVTWTKITNNVPTTISIASISRYSGGIPTVPGLTINPSQTSDAGTYRCAATNGLGTGTSGTTQLIVTSAATASIPLSSYTVVAGQQITIPCTVAGNPAVTSVTWTKITNNVPTTISIASISRYSGGTPTIPGLTINPSQTSDAGTYRCAATNGLGTGTSGTTQLIVTSAATASIPLSSYTVVAGQQITIPCTVAGNPAVTSVTWTKITNNVPTTISIASISRYSGGTPTIPGLTINPSQTSDAGTYRCAATNGLGTGTSGTTQLIVTSAATASIPLSSYTVVAGQQITIPCTVAGNPAVTSVTWTKITNNVPTTISIASISRYSGGTPTIPGLTINPSQTSDAGTYRCAATNGLGTGTSGTTQLIVTSAATASIPLSSYTVVAGQPITIPCTVAGNPAVTSVTWTKITNNVPTTISIASISRYSGGTPTIPGLTINPSQTSDAGTYRCAATNGLGTGTSGTTQLIVTSAATASIPLSSYTVVAGQPITIPCTVAGNPAVTSVTWTKITNNVPTTISIASISRYSGGTPTIPGLTINPSETSDAGTYRCAATNGLGTGTSGTTQLIVTSLPQVTVGQTIYTAVTGSAITLVCTVTANPAHTSVTWQKLVNNVFQAVPITTNSRYSGGITTSPSLAITNSQTGDSGTYRCTANNAVGTGVSQNTQLTVSGSLPQVTVGQTIYTAVTGSAITLVCTVTANPAHTSVTWQKLVNNVFQTVPITTNSRYSGGTTTSPSLAITNSQTGDGGTYRCTANNAVGTGVSQNTQLTVSGSLPQVTVGQTIYTAVTGSAITLVCTVTANPTHTSVTWQKLVNNVFQTVPITTNSRYSGGTTTSPSLAITSSQTGDSGTYRCTATNAVGTGVSQNTQLTVSGSLPQVTVGQTIYTAVTGSAITLVCTVTANPTHTSVTWQKLVNNVFQTVPITTNSRYSGGTTTSPSLAITNSQTGDSGTYRCTANNAVGTGVSQNTQLTVSGSLPQVAVGQTTYTAVTGSAITLVCTVTANPTHTSVTWQKLVNNVFQTVPITTNSRYSGGTTTSPSLAITNSQTGDSGTYRCTANNAVGTGVSQNTQLTVSGSLPQVAVGQTTYTAVTGSAITLVCTVTANPAHTSVTWQKLVNNVYQAVPITTNSRYSGGTTTSPSLAITSSQPGDSGTYRCTANNAVGTGVSQNTQLTVSGSVPTVSIGQNVYTATTGGAVTLICTVTADPAHESVLWQKLENGAYQDVSINTNSRYSGGTTSSPSLAITNSQPADSGTYRCTATNQVGTGTSGTTQLTISGSVPTVSIGQNVYTATTGGAVTLICTVTADPAHESVLWQKLENGAYQDVSINTNSRYSGGTTSSPSLAITNSQPADSGTYRCTATNQVGTGTSGTTQLTISGSVPTVSIGQNVYTATTGGAVTLICTVTADPAHESVLWQKLENGAYQDVSINTNSRYSGGTTSSPSLAITNSQPADSGTYRCTATNQVGTGTSGTTQLTISGSLPVVDIPQATYTVVTGAQIIIPCSVTATPPHTSITWERTSNGQMTTLNVANSGGKYSFGPLTSPSLTINTAASSDQGVYTCVAMNAVGIGRDTTTLSVTGSTPTVTIPQAGYSVQTGSSITIPCTITATPSVTIVGWKKIQGTVSSPLIVNGADYTGGSLTSPALTIPTASRTTHQGFYACTATNAVATGTSRTIFLAVTGDVPTVTVQTTPATATTGTAVTLQCVVTADPVATIVQWERVASNGAATVINVAGNAKYSGATPASPSLNIANTASTDNGAYRCSATNAIGKGTSGQVTLTVTGSLPVVTVASTSYSVVTGNSVTLQCSATGTPAVTTVSWERNANGQTTQLALSSGQFTISNPSLVISAAAIGDAGTYRCKAANAVGSAQSPQVNLVVTGAQPTVTIGANNYQGVTGSSVTLQCTVTATPSATLVRWTKTTTSGTNQITVDGTKYSGSSVASPSLVINSLTSADQGTYICQATNFVGTGTSTSTMLSITGSVPIVQVPQQSYNVIKGGTVILQCTVSGLPAATSVTWKRTSGGTETTVSTTAAKYSGSTVANPSLTITGADSVDAATYVCTATNSVGVGRSTQTSLSVTGDIPTVTVPDLTYSVISGKSVTLRCIVAATPPIDSVQWRMIKGTTTTDIDVSQAAYTGGTTGNPSLTIVTAKAADSAQYICTARNSVGTGESGRTTLSVTGAAPTVSIPVSSYTVITGKSVILVCQVAANPTASSISWSKTVGTQTSMLNIDNTKYTGGTIQTPSLTINNAASNDAASYECTATNVVGSTTSNPTVLTVTGGLPTATITNPDITAVLGSSVTINCQVTATPQATKIEWTRVIGGVTSPIVVSAKFVGSTVANPSLTINTLANTDQGNYICSATNEVGVGRSPAAKLTVTGSVPTVVISKASYSVVTGQDITIDCDFTASPDATSLKWRKVVNAQGTDIVVAGNAKYSGGILTTPSLTIKAAAASDQAFYQCVVANSVGEGVSKTAYLFVTGDAPTVTVTQTTYNVNLGAGFTINCNVAGVPTATSVSWTITKPPSTAANPLTITSPKYTGGTVNTPSLTITNAAQTDQGVYTCKATNIIGTGESGKVFVNVVGSAPVVSVPVTAYQVDVGGSVVLLCTVVANPPATQVYWTRSVSGAVNTITAAPPKYSGSVSTNPSLTINQLTSADEGSYRCHATNTVNTGQSGLTTLVVSVAPTNIRVNPPSVTRREGQSFSATCTAEGNPTPTYQWVKKSTQQVVSNVGTLAIQNIDRGHHGEYICTATNPRGSATAPFNVDVQYQPISTVTTAERDVILGLNDPRTLTCNTVANPSVDTYRWTKNNANIPGATALTYVATIAVATDYGSYTCYATNSIGESSAITFNLRSAAVTPVAPTPTTPPLSTESIIAIAVAVAVLLLILIIVCVCCLARSKEPKKTRVYTRKPTPAPMPMMSPIMMSEPSMAVVPMNSFRSQYDLPGQEFTYYESERAKE